MFQVIYATKNPAKLLAMQSRMKGLPVEILGLEEVHLVRPDLNIESLPQVTETGSTPLENAQLKARAYHKAIGFPVFSCDSGLYFEGDAKKEQPGVHVRTVNGVRLTDEQMVTHYAALAKKYGKIKAYYKNAICLVLDEKTEYKAMNPTMESGRFYLTDKPHKETKPGFPLDGISLTLDTMEYYYDVAREQLDEIAVEEGFLTFFQQVIVLQESQCATQELQTLR